MGGQNTEFSECQGCGFVLRATASTDPQPKHWEACPDCGAAEFEFVE